MHQGPIQDFKDNPYFGQKNQHYIFVEIYVKITKFINRNYKMNGHSIKLFLNSYYHLILN